MIHSIYINRNGTIQIGKRLFENYADKLWNELSQNELSQNELSQNELSQNELSQNELSQNELSQNELSQNIQYVD